MRNKPIIIVSGEPYSVFLEIFFKTLKTKKFKKLKKPVILICSYELAKIQMKKLGYNFKINKINQNDLPNINKINNQINLINVDFKFDKPFDKISSKSNEYINTCFTKALSIIKQYKLNYLINGPVSKEHFLRKKFPGMTEFFAKKTGSSNKEVMLIHGKNISVSPLTTHLPLKRIFSKISKKKIIHQITIINNFYKKYMNKKPVFALTGLNPHCETLSKYSEEKKILIPAIKNLNRINIKVFGPFAADTLFIKDNLKKFDVILGMYHDQVLTPIKTIYEFKAINITLGLPFIRITPDHGPNNQMLGKNLSKPDSFQEAIDFINKAK